MKIRNHKSSKTMILSSLAALTLVGGVTAVALSSNAVSEQRNQLLNNKNLKSFSPNIGRQDSLTNPDELFYANPVLNTTDKPIFDGSGNPIQANIDVWNQFSTNVSNLSVPTSLPQSVKTEVNNLKNIGAAIKASIQLNLKINEAKTAWTNAVNNDPILSGIIDQNLSNEIWTDKIKPGVINQNQNLITQGAQEDIEQIPGINDIQSSLIKISGISEGTYIENINNPRTFQERNLSGNSSAPVSIGINTIAGAEYKQLIKIAEIDPSTAGTYVISFNYRESNVSATVKGKVFIKNEGNQLTNAQANMEDLSTKLDVFGRWDGKDIIVGQGQYKQMLDNFIIQNNNGKIEVLVRVKANETLGNIRFETEIDGTSASNLQQPSRFGILDVQANDNKTFLGTINPNAGVTKLVENIDDKAKVVNSIQFFSNTFRTTVQPTTDGSIIKNRKLEFYQGPGDDSTKVSLGLNVAQPLDPNAENQMQYEAIDAYDENGNNTHTQVKIDLVANGTGASRLTQEKYKLYKDYVAKLPKKINDSNFKEASTITLDSAVDTSSSLTRQSFLYSDFFYAVGNNTDGWDSFDLKNDVTFNISDPTQKIFSEKPVAFNDQSLTTETSTMEAEKATDIEDQAIKMMAEIYSEFGKSSTNVITGEFSFNNPVNVWKANGSTWGSYTNFSSSQQTISGSANTIYRALNNDWNYISSAEKQMFEGFESVKPNKYDVVNASQVVNKYLCTVTEFTPNGALVQQVIKKATEILSSDANYSDTVALNNLSLDTRNNLASQLVALIEIQFSTINNEFQSQLTNAVFSKLITAVESQSQTASLKAPADLFVNSNSNTYKNLITYQPDAWKNIGANEVSIKNAMKSLFDVLYFNSENGFPLGTSIFMSLDGRSTFRQLNSDTLTTNIAQADNNLKQGITKVYNEVLKRLGNNTFDFQVALNNMLKNGKPIELKASDIENAIKQTINNVINGKRDAKAENDTTVTSNYLDDVISGTNILIALTQKQQSLGGGITTRAIDPSTINEKDITPGNVLGKIDEIINGNSQYNSFELSQWADVINGDPNYSSFTEALSGRLGTGDFDKMIAAITNDRNILAKASIQDSAPSAVVQLEKILKQLWWIIVALVGAGVLVVSSVGIATKDRRVKLSSRPVLKWLLVSGIVLGLAVAAIAIVVGIVI